MVHASGIYAPAIKRRFDAARACAPAAMANDRARNTRFIIGIGPCLPALRREK